MMRRFISKKALFVTLLTIVACHPLSPSGGPASNAPQASPTPAPNGADNSTQLQPADFVPANELIGTYQGYAAINSFLKSRLVKPNTVFDLSFYLDGGMSEPLGLFPGELFKLLGTYQSDGLRSDFQNAMPNGINMLIWYVAFSGVSDEIAAICSGGLDLGAAARAFRPAPEYRDEIVASVNRLCDWNVMSPDGRRDALKAYWVVLMGGGIPLAERDAWLDLAASDEYVAKSNQEIVSEITVAALFNPYLLIRH